jgi:hypothetical protein
MKDDKHNEEWREGDATWRLLGKAAPKQASARFADDVVRAVRLLPEVDSFWPRILKFSSWVAVAACLVLIASIFFDSPAANSDGGLAGSHGPKPIVSAGEIIRVNAVVNQEAQWEQIEDVAQAELLAAAAEHLDEFSNQDLVMMIGF